MPVVEQGPGGAVAAPGTFQILNVRSDIQVYGAAQVRDAVVVTVQDLIYGIIFSFTMPRSGNSSWDELGPATAGGEYTGVVQSIAAMQEVIAVGYTQEPDASGLLLDKLVVTITDPQQLSQIDVTVPLNPASPDIAVKMIGDEYAILLRNLGQ